MSAGRGKALALLGLLAGAAALFCFGLPGNFVLDDYANLYGLDKIAGSAFKAALYILDAPTGFPGRPLSYLSFALQYSSWPRDPAAFKLVNIALHLLNGVAIWAVLDRTLRLRGESSFRWLPLIAAGVWLVHPIQVSTVLYVVQRMTELSTLFTLLALFAYLHGRALAVNGTARRAYVWMTASVVLGTGLATLAKENGALLPLFILVLEATLLGSVLRPRGWKLWAALVLVLPLLALGAYIATGPGSPAAYATRPFDLAQRLYTEATVLWEYVWKMAFPRPRSLGLYFDDHPVAAAPWSSLMSAAAIAAWIAALAAAILLRAKLPYLSFAILWFLAGHLLESTIIPLELYFEHRNYLPLLGPAVGLAWAARWLWTNASAANTRVAYGALGAAALFALSGVTWIEARTWADPVKQLVVWAQEHPESLRAQYELGNTYVYGKQYKQAEEVFARAEARNPGDAQFALTRVTLACATSEVALPDKSEVTRTIAASPVRPGTINLFDSIVQSLEDDRCSRIDAAYAMGLADAFLANPLIAGNFRRVVLTLKARIYAVEGNLDGAVRNLEAADRIGPTLSSLQLQVVWLLSADLYEDALRAIQRGRADPRWRPWQKAAYSGLFDSWERQVRQVARSKGAEVRS
jgi:tetratricopeptide (TPR) repeat protein